MANTANPFLNFDELRRGSSGMLDLIEECYSKTDDVKVLPDVKPGFMRNTLP